MALTTLDENKSFLGISLSDHTYDVILEIFRRAIENCVINYCENDFLSTARTKELCDGSLSDVIVPKYFPIISVQAIYFGCDGSGNNGDLVDADNYSFDATGIILRNGIDTPYGRKYIRIDYTSGYASVPDDVKLVVYQSVKSEYQRHNRKTEDVGSRSKGDESESYNSAWDKKSGLPVQVVSKLQSYRTYEIPQIGIAQRNR
jgi:hypothetical protein